MPVHTLTVNGNSHEVDVDSSTPLLYVLRNDLDLKGPRFGCGLAQCGACTVLVDGRPVSSCILLAVQADGREIRTVEGLERDGRLSPLQEAFLKNGAVQCGYCTPGFLMTATALLEENPSPSRDEIVDALRGNICRCTGYKKIVEAVEMAARAPRV